MHGNRLSVKTLYVNWKLLLITTLNKIFHSFCPLGLNKTLVLVISSHKPDQLIWMSHNIM
jgi:hypothetical protein